MTLNRNQTITIALFLTVLFLGTGATYADDLKRTGAFGVRVSEVPSDMRKQLNLPAGEGILVAEVFKGGSADAAGLQPQDIILKFNDLTISEVNTFVSLVRKTHGGDEVQLSLLRAGKALTKVVLVKARPFETSPDFDIVYQSVTVDGSRRRVIITRPKAAGKYPAVILVNGIGCYSQDNLDPAEPMGQILYTLTRKGFVTMRVEKSGMGDSEGPPCTSPQVDLQAELRGYAGGLKALKSYDYVDPDRVFIFGHSMGGTVGPMLASEIPVKGLIVAETVGKSWFEYLLENSRRQQLLAGKSFDETERDVRREELCYHRLYVERQSLDQINKDIPECAQVEYLNTNAPLTYLQQVIGLNLAAIWKNVNAPVLVIYGTADFVTSEEEHQYLTRMINSFHPGAAKFVRIENMDHLLERAASQLESMQRRQKGQPGQFNPAILTEIESWLSDHKGSDSAHL